MQTVSHCTCIRNDIPQAIVSICGAVRLWHYTPCSFRYFRTTRETTRTKSFPEKRSWHKQSRDTKREEEGEYSDSKFGPLIAGVLLIHRDTINSPKSSQWVRRGEDSEARRCRRKSIDPKTPGCPRRPTSCWPGPYCSPFSRGTAANTHTHTHTHTHRDRHTHTHRDTHTHTHTHTHTEE